MVVWWAYSRTRVCIGAYFRVYPSGAWGQLVRPNCSGYMSQDWGLHGGICHRGMWLFSKSRCVEKKTDILSALKYLLIFISLCYNLWCNIVYTTNSVKCLTSTWCCMATLGAVYQCLVLACQVLGTSFTDAWQSLCKLLSNSCEALVDWLIFVCWMITTSWQAFVKQVSSTCQTSTKCLTGITKGICQELDRISGVEVYNCVIETLFCKMWWL